MKASARIIRGKLLVPPIPDRVVHRGRLVERLNALVDARQVTLIVATAGSGKTTAVVQAVRRSARPVAWLTVDPIDAAAGRFLTYLEAALADQVPAAAGVASAALAARLPHAEAAGLLAEALGDEELLLVLDGVENICQGDNTATLATLVSFMRYAAPSVRCVLLSRVSVPIDTAGFVAVEHVAEVGEDELAFTPAEAEAALSNAGRADVAIDDAIEATGGWVTGVLFEAWRSEAHVMGSGGEADPLHGYLASQILSKLSPEEQNLLIVGSLLDEITPHRANALGVNDAGTLLAALRDKHLPVTWSNVDLGMRCHPRFREYLSTLLRRRPAEQERAAREAYGRLLFAEGHFEEAVEAFLSVGCTHDALTAAELAIADVVSRLDLDVADRWLTALTPDRWRHSLGLAQAGIASAVAREDFGRAVAVSDQLAASGLRDTLARTNSTAASMMVWAYWHLTRVDDARNVLAIAEPSAALEAVRYLMDLVEIGPDGPVPEPPLTGGPLDALVKRVHYARGRLSDVLEAPQTPWSVAVSAPWRTGALRASGRLEESSELQGLEGDTTWAVAWRKGIVAPELLIDLGSAEEARDALVQGREHILASGSVVFGWLNLLIEAKLALRLDKDATLAHRVLDRVESAGGRNYGFIAELVDTWRGYALLLQDRPAEAQAVLQSSAQTMAACERSLELPTAAVYLAEAHWRLDAPAAADYWADEALRAADSQRSNHQLMTALADCPGVVSRRLDAEVDNDSRWHEIGQHLAAGGVVSGLVAARVTVHLREFGTPQLLVDDVPKKPRIAKSLVLLAYLAHASAHQASREELLDVLFEGRDDESTRSYLRQTVHRLRELLPEGAGPSFDGRILRFTAPVVCTSESVNLERRLHEGMRLQGAQQRRAIIDALTVAGKGPYFGDSPNQWIERRREHLLKLAGRANLHLARSSLMAEQLIDAEQYAERSVRDDPYQESAWRLLMRIGNALGDEDRVIAAYRRCKATLRDLDAEPSDSTRRLLDQLRR
ncbi:hypothetical protein GCM10023339_40360 [Alloalcanivorax gelatiniphagus]